MSTPYDLCVIGAGTAGFAAAQAADALGRRVVLVSGPGALGGTCILRGCMPAKTLLSSTERLAEVRDAPELGVQPAAVRVDLPAIVRRKRDLVEYFAEDRIADLERFPLVRGRARFLTADTIDVDGERIRAAHVVIATGSRVELGAAAPVPASDVMTSDDALEMKSVPQSLAVIGGGPVGCEFAQYFARLGARVTLLQDDAELLRREDRDVGAAIRVALERDGVEVVLDARLTGYAGGAAGARVAYERGDVAAELVVEQVMLATGRVPNVTGLQLEAAGIATSPAGGIAIDPYLRTSAATVYAAGDVLGRRCLVHVAEYAGRLAARNALAATPTPVAADFERFEAHAVYTQPQVAVAGLTERACAEAGIAVEVRRHPFRDLGKALVADTPEGFVKMLADVDGRIRGVAVVGDDASEMIGEAVALIDRHATVRDVAEMPHLHPTLGEIFGRVADDFATTVR